MGISLLRASAGSVSQEKKNALCLSEFIVISHRSENKSVVTFFPALLEVCGTSITRKISLPYALYSLVDIFWDPETQGKHRRGPFCLLWHLFPLTRTNPEVHLPHHPTASFIILFLDLSRKKLSITEILTFLLAAFLDSFSPWVAKVTIGQTLQHLFCKMLQKGACDINSKEVSFEWGPQTAGFFSRTQKLGHLTLLPHWPWKWKGWSYNFRVVFNKWRPRRKLEKSNLVFEIICKVGGKEDNFLNLHFVLWTASLFSRELRERCGHSRWECARSLLHVSIHVPWQRIPFMYVRWREIERKMVRNNWKLH